MRPAGVIRVMFNKRDGMACGLDGTCTELFKGCVSSFAPLMAVLFNACLSAGRVSDTMMRGVATQQAEAS